MIKKSIIKFVVILAVTSLVGGSMQSWAMQDNGVPAARQWDSKPVQDVPLYKSPVLNLVELASEDLERDQNGEPYRFALPQVVNLTPENSGVWETLDSGDMLWRLRVSCPGVKSLNLGFTEYNLPWGAQLQVYAADYSGTAMRFDSSDNKPHRQLWTPVLLADDLIVEVLVAAKNRDEVSLVLGSVNRGYRNFGNEDNYLGNDKSGGCNIDVVCSEGDNWRDEIDSVAAYSFGGSIKCTGVMVNNTSRDGKPLFLTALHCNASTANAPSMVIYWNFQSPTCGQHGGGDQTQTQTGATLVAANAATDMTLVELDDVPPAAYEVKYAGWSRDALAPSRAVGIHHPSGDEKSISFENASCLVTTHLQDTGPGNGTHLRVVDWDLGTTEPGSSGSPLFDQNHQVVGQLHGGFAACGNDESDWYGRLFLSWTGGGTAESRLSDWLDPGATGVTSLDLYDPSNPDGPVPGETSNLQITSISPNPFKTVAFVEYHLDKAAVVEGKVVDIRGQLVKNLGQVSGNLGDNELAWNGTNNKGQRLAAGPYILVLSAEGKTVLQNLMYLH